MIEFKNSSYNKYIKTDGPEFNHIPEKEETKKEVDSEMVT